MATDYDAPRQREEDTVETDSLEGLKAAEQRLLASEDDDDSDAPSDAPHVDYSGEELNVDVVPRQADEFTCSSCFLVQKVTRRAEIEPDGSEICFDCA